MEVAECSFKVCAVSESGEKQVRRFGIDKAVVSCFSYVDAKLQEIFTWLKGKSYLIFWIDEDGDEVFISSDEELKVALKCMENLPNIKLLVRMKVTNKPVIGFNICEQPHLDSILKVTHFNVICDVCDKEIQGFRYKCVTCSNYDLCGDCEYAGEHPEHYMVRLPIRMSPDLNFPRGVSHHLFKSVHRDGLRCQRSQTENTAECPFTKKHKKDRHAKVDSHRKNGDNHCGKSEHGGYRSRRREGWLRTFATYMNEFANVAGDVPIDSESSDDEPTPTKAAKMEKIAKPDMAKQQQPILPIQIDGLLSPDNIREIQRNIHQGITELIKVASTPFGVPEVNVPNESQPTTSQTVETAYDRSSVKSDSSGDKQTQTEKTKTSNKILIHDDKTNEDWTLINDIQDASKPNENKVECVNKLCPDFETHVNVTEKIYPNIPPSSASIEDATAPKEHREKLPQHIEQALQQMMAMGFSDDGNWLSKLLLSKDGNIRAVLDLLTPKK